MDDKITAGSFLDILQQVKRELVASMDDKITAGSFLDPRPNDPVFHNLDAAMIWAREAASKDEHFAIAVWTGHTLYRVLLRGFELTDINNDERW